jgi:S-methylmethionine-dependent homocysteine/selenocysteine methylase
MNDFTARLNSGQLLLLDGATGTELTRRRVDTHLPLWSAAALLKAPQVVRAIHADYVRAGAQIITTNTFRTHRRSLAKDGLDPRTRELTHIAVRLAREAIAQSRAPGRVCIAGSIAPLEDCYSPQRVPPDAELQVEHAEMAQHLAEAEVDLLLVETMNTIREGYFAAQAAQSTGLPFVVSFVCEATSQGAKLLSGESLRDAARVVSALCPAAIMVNCAPVDQIDSLLWELRASTDLPIGAYGNVGHVDHEVGWTLTHAVTPDAYARAARKWRAIGASIIGGCCGTQPAHIAALQRAFQIQHHPAQA